MYVPVFSLLIDDQEEFRIVEEFRCECDGCFGGCPCKERFGGGDGEFDKPRFECGDNCKCKNCGNRTVLVADIPKITVRNAGVKGLGVFSEEYIEKGQYIGEYAGKVVDDESEGEYVFQIKENTPSRTFTTTIDAGFYGNFTRFLNHSCEPNLIAVPIRVNFTIPNIGFFSVRPIHPNEELSFSYRDSPLGRPCLCRSANCKGYF
jgi:histone-lysine N-methyltransferase SETMAR